MGRCVLIQMDTKRNKRARTSQPVQLQSPVQVIGPNGRGVPWGVAVEHRRENTSSTRLLQVAEPRAHIRTVKHSLKRVTQCRVVVRQLLEVGMTLVASYALDRQIQTHIFINRVQLHSHRTRLEPQLHRPVE